ncbi:Gamma-tubulin complex component 5 [Branchiostoma belcheri]|nr:Gamma-tubulin complex component 5 [Branchiostoma belcheri]
MAGEESSLAPQQNRISTTLWNNSSAPPFASGNTSPFEKFDGQTSCLMWHLQNKTVFQGYTEAQQACSIYDNTEELGTTTAVISWVLGLLIVTGNAVVILGIVRTTQLHKPLYIYMTNLAVSDLVGGSGLLVGWNCLDINTPNCLLFYHTAFVGIVATLAIVLAGIMLFTNISTFVAVKQRQKRRFGQQPRNNLGQNGTGQHQPHNIAQNEAERKFKKSVQKARTVLIYVVVAFIFWLLPVVLLPICQRECPLIAGPHERAVMLTFNSAINPIASIIRTPDLRRGIWQTVMDIRRNPANPQVQQPVSIPRGGTTGNTGPDIPTGQLITGYNNNPVNIPAGQLTAGHSNRPVNIPAGQLTAGHSNSPVNIPAGQPTAGHGNSPVTYQQDSTPQDTATVLSTYQQDSSPQDTATVLSTYQQDSSPRDTATALSTRVWLCQK